ncbi:MAG: nuclear transport factor 2 family protein [Kangiellaceae bacterium]|nr:nuclear transport factor 2 family protein [Kangiellaceae bacterium]MCW8998929.1 nuclear transport factor 2 family protein [Kangiellaceae bacterium]MCW9018409.1 nuclear transport factor 2 family protein [Kangiellaceae bacterium]
MNIEQNEKLINAVQQASKQWKTAFNSGDAQGCAACYESEATMLAEPFGSFHGTNEIRSFWQKLIDDGFSNVEYLNPEIQVIDEHSAELRSGWKMNNASGVIHKEIWVLQQDGSAKLREDHFEAIG